MHIISRTCQNTSSLNKFNKLKEFLYLTNAFHLAVKTSPFPLLMVNKHNPFVELSRRSGYSRCSPRKIYLRQTLVYKSYIYILTEYFDTDENIRNDIFIHFADLAELSKPIYSSNFWVLPCTINQLSLQIISEVCQPWLKHELHFPFS